LGLFAIAALIGASGVLITDGPATTSAAPTTYRALAGNGARGIAVNVFMPRSLVVNEGDTISWSNPYEEPHNIAFLADKPAPKDNMASVGDKAPKLDGTQQLASGFLRKGDKYDVTFTKTGSYSLICLVHDGQTVSVNVISPGMYVPSQAQIDAEVRTLQTQGLAAGDKLIAGIPPVARASNSNGTSTWTVPDSPVTTVTGGNVNINLFVPARLQIGVGDTITWLDNTTVPHTVTFLAGGPPKGPPTVPNRPAGGLYDGSGYANSGFMGTAPDRLGATRFSLTFTQPGTYPYVCILHADQGMAGVVEVSAAGAGTPALRPPATGDAGLASYSMAAWPLALIVALLGIGSIAAINVRAQA
jgi:plastocyanin